ncbi:PPC domain-containing DNA-binding protein [Compostibacter hankyongensis]
MKSKLINSTGQITYVLIFDKGDEVAAGILSFAEEHNISAASFTAIGAFSDALLGFFDFSSKDYKKIPMPGQTEVLALTGDIAQQDGKPKIHAHVVLGKPDGAAYGGHLLEAHVDPTLEVILIQSPAYLQRKTDKRTGLGLITLPS